MPSRTFSTPVALWRCFASARDSFAEKLHRNPLIELQKQCVARGNCDQQGFRKKGAPWAFQLAEQVQLSRGSGQASSPWPSLRTVGWQRISAKGLDFMVRRAERTESQNNTCVVSHTGEPNQPRECISAMKPVSICYVEGIYPPPKDGPPCIQWRIEGIAIPVSTKDLLKTAPIGSISQIVTISLKNQGGHDASHVDEGGSHGHEGGSLVSTDSQKHHRVRPSLSDNEQLLQETEAMQRNLQENGDSESVTKAVANACVAYRVFPRRMEMMQSGELWERFEWINVNFDSVYKRMKENGERSRVGLDLEWSQPRRLMPY
eukprot:TRINITY_DN50256_c0_g1_i1.p1 TRINITY_DN50256_c0_g1~~TRINITY_DN50256_c0_g1_i1.p1  ORF type:complete len:318 (+),score=43.16 TRINITY_DN50256_c0_g1_i1:87-1040(+)